MDGHANGAHSAAPRQQVHVEACALRHSTASFAHIQQHVRAFMTQHGASLKPGRVDFDASAFLQQHLARLEIAISADEDDADDVMGDVMDLSRRDDALHVHVFKLSDEPPADETADDDENVATCQQLVLPSTSLDGLWESLIYDAAIKRRVLDYAATAMLFSDVKVNPHLITWNRVVLLHGPPGTGKTSLCKALAQKLSIRLGDRFPSAHLIEINAHSLFSKWFSESGKLVMKLFRQIQDLVEDADALVCVLIDEVESLTAARRAALNGAEPSDAIRVVNALLTQLDALKQYANVLVLTTSNITAAIDVAFVDRADIKQYIALPSVHSRYEILRTCVDELVRVGLLRDEPIDAAGAASTSTPSLLLPYRALLRKRANRKRDADQMRAADDTHDPDAISSALLRVAESTEGFSGRSLRKLPFQAHASFVQSRVTSIATFLQYLARTAEEEAAHKSQLAAE